MEKVPWPTHYWLNSEMVERERGITVKAQTVSMMYKGEYLLNLIDTPGHYDFCYEVSRSLKSCQGAILLVDATQGIQAQTLSTYRAAVDAGVILLPVVTKIDLPNAKIVEAVLSMAAVFSLEPDNVLTVSSKTGEGIDLLLENIVQRFPAPSLHFSATNPLQLHVLDNWYDPTRGIISLIMCVNGILKENIRLTTHSLFEKSQPFQSSTVGSSFLVQEVGILTPERLRTKCLFPGQVGYVIGAKKEHSITIGETMITVPSTPLDLPKKLEFFPCSQPNIYASCFPMDGDDFMSLSKAVEKLSMNDSSLDIHQEESTSLGNGFQIGFLGILHMEVFMQRLSSEFGVSALITAPAVSYISKEKHTGVETEIRNVRDWKKNINNKRNFTILEPMVEVSVLFRMENIGVLKMLMKEKRGTEVETRYIDGETVEILYKVPWQEVVNNLNDRIKSISSGYASFSYKLIPPEPADLVLCEIAVNGDMIESLSFICHRSKAYEQGKELIQRLKEVIPRQQFEIVVQALLHSKPFAKERISPFRKNVLVKSGKVVGGGDPSRKKKLLQKQKVGKKKTKSIGKVQLPQSAFWNILAK